MIWLGLVAIFGGIDPPAAAPPAADPPHNYLRGAQARECRDSGKADEVVVCGTNDPDRDRVKPIDGDRYAERPVRAETRIFGDGKINLHGETSDVGGTPSQRAMVTLSLPF
jgi:hypothetical protein